MRFPPVVLLLALLLPAPAKAQAPPAKMRSVAQQDTVILRLSPNDTVLQGVVAAIRPSEWLLRLPDGESLVVPTSSIVSAEVLTQYRYTERGALIGGLVGAGIGAVLWLAFSDDDNCDDDGIGVCDVLVQPVLDAGGTVLAMLSTAGGVLFGALIGGSTTSSRWVPAEVPGSTLALSRRLNLGVSVRLQGSGRR